MNRKRGLTLGKYAPFHRGHQLVLETALAEMDEVIVIIYDAPETIAIPLGVRAEWIRALYPAVTVVEAWDGPTEVGDTPEIRKAHEEYIIGRLGITGITHFYSSEFYGGHMSRALCAVNRIVDRGRLALPVSGTAIRGNPFRWREYLHPLVYRDLITNVALLGAPSTGKTTIAQRLAQEYSTVWMPEYGREFWERHQVGRRLAPEQLAGIAEGHLEREEALLREADRYLFTDTNALTTAVFARYYHGGMLPRLEELATLAVHRYDIVFLCGDDIPYDDTWDRSGAGNRALLQQMTLDELLRRNIPFIHLCGDMERRVGRVRDVLSGYRKY
jgi:NadR type nicotinamide-nucleotide adenylyltransferase